tara:strand:- start:368 stop:1000 length:633 start_codon:yes stop_codon:yes gene_type:complete
MVDIGKQSVGSTTNLFQGYWSHVEFRPGGYDVAEATKRYLGVVQEGVLEVSREDVEYMGTTFPRVVELLTPSQMGMKFSGQIDELHQTNMLLAVGDDASVAAATQEGYIYPGASCGFGANEFGSLVCRRKRCSTDAPFVMEACLWKTVGSGAISIGGDADVVGTTVEFNALDDSNGEFMDQNPNWKNSAANHPLGYIFSPAPAANSTAVA